MIFAIATTLRILRSFVREEQAMSDGIMELYLANRNRTLGLEEVADRDMVDIRPASRRAVPLNEPVAPIPAYIIPTEPTDLRRAHH